jgi:hypothetical protein
MTEHRSQPEVVDRGGIGHFNSVVSFSNVPLAFEQHLHFVVFDDRPAASLTA